VALFFGLVLTVEEAQAAGGLGSAVTELLSEEHPVRIRRMGMPDCYGESGKPEELLEHFKLTPKYIVFNAHSLLGKES
jgi:transketolase